MLKPEDIERMSSLAEQWFEKEARTLSFRENRTPYRVWVSEVMLQQTQVFKVVDYFDRFMARFPSVRELANASEDEVLSYWSGLGYYSRCRNLHSAAKVIVGEHGGEFPQTFESISSLPGIGSYTAGAICSFAYNQVAPVVDGNIARVLSRLCADATPVDSPSGKKHFEGLSVAFAERAQRPGLMQEALMEIGAMLCKPTTPLCTSCPLTDYCEAKKLATTLSFPTKGKKTARKELHGVFAIIADEHRVWLEKNEHSRLFKKLYAPPHAMIEDPKEAAQALMGLSQQFGFALPKAIPESIVVVRELTHRTFYMHGYVIPAQNELPNARWFSRAQLSQIGLSSAVSALLKKTGFLAMSLFLLSGCTYNQTKVRLKPQRHTEANSSVRPVEAGWRQQVMQVALDFVGKKQVKFNKVYFRRDCSGTVRGIFEIAGKSLKEAMGKRGESDSKALFDYAKKVGRITLSDPKVGDMVFFDNTYDVNRDGKMNDRFSHVGVVTRVYDDKSVAFVHYSGGVILESTMNDELRRGKRKSTGKTGAELFRGYGQLDQITRPRPEESHMK